MWHATRDRTSLLILLLSVATLGLKLQLEPPSSPLSPSLLVSLLSSLPPLPLLHSRESSRFLCPSSCLFRRPRYFGSFFSARPIRGCTGECGSEYPGLRKSAGPANWATMRSLLLIHPPLISSASSPSPLSLCSLSSSPWICSSSSSELSLVEILAGCPSQYAKSFS